MYAVAPDTADFRLKTLDFLRAHAKARGSGGFSPLWSDQNPTGCREIPAAWLTQELAASLWRAGANS